MGSLLSKPKMPSLPKFTPTPVDPVKEEPEKEPEPTPDEQRARNILMRHRGRLGTIGTSFRGVLSDQSLTPTRKTLLGE